VKHRPWLAALLAAASCRSARPAPTDAAGAAAGGAFVAADAGDPGPADGGDPGAADAGDTGAADGGGVAAAIAQAEASADPDRRIQILEDASLTVAEPAELLLRAARARKQRLESAPFAAQPEAVADVARDAKACAADAHRSWAQRYPAAAAELDSGRPAAAVYAQIADAEPLYLEAVCAAAWARTQGFTQLVERRAELGAGLRRAAALAPGLDAAGPQRELGRLLAALPTYAGGDLAEARLSFEAAIARAPQAAVNRLAYARSVGVKAQDRSLFEAQLKAVAGGDDKLAAAEAAELLSREDDLFGPAQAAQPVPGGHQR
jgi:hypothetical protein